MGATAFWGLMYACENLLILFQKMASDMFDEMIDIMRALMRKKDMWNTRLPSLPSTL